ncbi:MAG: RNA polymerase factor sigma-54 [Armatimonadetes bacterium]|nr:RNA polymerase factor sigma-54 [Armatimonadota bacterium]
MQLTLGQEARLEQTLSPRMIQFYQMLQCPLQDLDQLITAELTENPALELVEQPPVDSLPDDFEGYFAEAAPDDDDPVARLPAPTTLRDHLRWHFLALARSDTERRVGLRLIEEVNAEGYFEGQIGEVALLLEVGVVEVERVLGLVQRLEPYGVGARDLRECLQIQLAVLREQGREHTVAWRITQECWEPFCKNQYAACARKLKISERAVADAAEFMRRNCHPYPGREFRLPWQDEATAPQVCPEVIVRAEGEPPPPFRVEVPESRSLTLRIDRIYRRLYDELRRGGTRSDEASHIESCVRRAQQFIRSLEQRRETLRRIAQEVVNEQEEFVLRGPTYLRPLTRLELARRLGIHESTVGRAVAGKFVQLPSQEVVPLERFFESAQPVKLALERLLASENKRQPLSDQALAERLAAEGYDIARRTVAKYRQELKVPPASQRRQ